MSGETGRARRARWRTLVELERRIEPVMVVLGLVWLALLVFELTRGQNAVLQAAGIVIWILFILDFVLRLALAPDRGLYLKRNWVTALALLIPALRVLRLLRVLRVLRLVRGVRLVRVVATLNRGMQSIGRGMRRRGAGYAFALTVLVLFGGSAGMLAFERGVEGTGLRSYGDALWWTAMIITTLGSEYWPRTPEGRILAVLLAFYALGVLGYITATLASFFLGRDASAVRTAADPEVAALRRELAALRQQLGDRGLH